LIVKLAATTTKQTVTIYSNTTAMARQRQKARRNVRGSYSSSYGLMSDSALVPPPVGSNETATDSSDNASTETHPTAPLDTITEMPTRATSESPIADSAAISETRTVPPAPPTDLDPSAVITETTTVPPKPTTDPDPSAAITEMSSALTDECTESQNSTNMPIIMAPSETGTESSSSPLTTANTETPKADRDNFMNFELPRKIDFLDKDYLNNMLKKDELCFISFKMLCECYFQHKQLMQLCNLTYESLEDKSNKNASFFVCIGKRGGYDKILNVPFNSKRIDLIKALYIEKSPNYQNLFVPFLHTMFKVDNLDILNETYTREDILTISLFYRETYKHATSKKIYFRDHLIGVASIVQDEQPSCLLVWLGIVRSFPCKKYPLVGAWKEKFDNMQGALNLGSFFICTIQWIKSILLGQWTPVTCQVFQGAKSGPLYFYKKTYFIRLDRDHELIHLQYLRRREHIIDDDKTLHWYALFHPLQYLTMFEINALNDKHELIGIIVNRANHFFLTQRIHSYPVDEVVPYFEQFFGSPLDNNTSLQITKALPDVWIRLEVDDNQQIHQVFATKEVLNSMVEVNENLKLKTMNLFESDNNVDPASYIFRLASKVFFGSASYHYIIRQFYYFIFKSLSKLTKGHPFFEQVMPVLVELIIRRTYFNSGYGFNELKFINTLPDTVEEMQDSRTGRILKMYYSALLNLYAESFLRSKFQGDECDIYFLKEIFNSSLSIINVTSTDTMPFEQNYMRSYDIKIHPTNNAPFPLFPSFEKIKPLSDYIKGVPSTKINRISKHIWLARVAINELYIMTLNDKYEERRLKLPVSVGGCELFTVIKDVVIDDDDDDEAIAFQFDESFDAIINRVEEESNASITEKIIQNYIEARKWKNYKKLFKTTKGGKILDNDPDELTIGPLFELVDLSNARVDNDLVMPILRLLDPWKEVVYSQTQAIRNKISYTEIITLRKETWLSDCAIDIFIAILNDPKKGFSTRTWVLSPTKFGFIIQSAQSIQRFVESLPSNCSKILIFVHSNDHYLIAEVTIPSNEDKELTIHIADSLQKEYTLEDMIEDVKSANVDLLAAAFCPNLPIRYHMAKDVIQQDNDYDCGVCCSQRAYFYKRFDNPFTAPQGSDYLKDTVIFRVFMLEEILKHYRHRLSPLVYHDSPINKPVVWKINNILIPESLQANVEEKPPSTTLHQDEKYVAQASFNNSGGSNQVPFINDGVSNAPSENKKSEINLNQEQTLAVPSHPKAPRGHKSVRGKGLFLMGAAGGSGSGSSDSGNDSDRGDDDSSDTATINNDAEDKSDKDNKKTSENEDVGDDAEEDDSDYSENANAELDNTTKVTTKVLTRAHKFKITTTRQLVEEREPDSVAATSVENDEVTEQESPINKKKRKISPEETSNKTVKDVEASKKKSSVSKSKAKSVAKAVTFDGSTKKKIYGNRKQKTDKNITKKEVRMQKSKLKAKERLRKKQLTGINNEIKRWETWFDVPPDTLELDIFSEDPNYFIDKKIPAKTQREMNHDIDRMKTKMYEPLQYDFERAKLAVDSEYKVAIGIAEDRHNNAKKDLKSIADQPHSAKYKKLQNTVLELRERKKFLKYQSDTLAELLPFDAVYGLRMKQGSNGKEYYVVAKLPDGSFKEKLVTRDWINKHVEKDYLNRYYQAEDERGWVLFSQEDGDGKIQSDTNELRQLLQDKAVQPVYQYKLDDDDERIHCVRCAVTFRSPYIRQIPSSIDWAIMTEKHSVNKNSSELGPWNNTDDNGQKHHIYWDCKETLLSPALGECFDLIKSAVKEHWEAEYNQAGTPHLKPKFHLDDNPHVEFLPNTERFIDKCDLSKGSFLKQRPAVFSRDYCGIFSNRQYYYFDLREIKTHYFINVNTRQISGIYYDPLSKRFTGLEKFRERGHQKFKKVELETEWVKTNIDAVVIKAAIEKATVDQKRFIKLPVGLQREMQTLKECKRYPKIVYPQYGKDTCVFSSLSSALFYLQYEDVALQIDNFKLKIMKEEFYESFENLMGRITDYIHNDPFFGIFRKKCDRRKIIYCEKFNLIEECNKKHNVLHHVVIISKDGGENHAICVVHNLIFDGNFTNALPLSQEYLNKSCDSTYLGIASGYKYIFDN
jgi:hypothetical protein